MIAPTTAADPPRVAAIRSFVRRRRRRPGFDWYFIAFAVVLTLILLSDLVAQPFGRLTGSGGSAPAQAVAGAALVIGAAAGLLILAQAFGPLALWRGRRLASRPWPRLAAFAPGLSPAFVLAWADWRRLARRPAVLTALAVSTLAPALAGAAFSTREVIRFAA
jgi:hypothetical protein